MKYVEITCGAVIQDFFVHEIQVWFAFSILCSLLIAFAQMLKMNFPETTKPIIVSTIAC
jgi:uncharacterized membrane protein